MGTVRFGNDYVAAILGFDDLRWGNILITRVYFIEGLGHNLFSKTVLSKEGFDNFNLKYLGGFWVLIEFRTKESLENFKSHVGVGSWFSSLEYASNSFVIDESVVWVDIEAVPMKIWTNNTFNKISSKWGELLFDEDRKNMSMYSKRICIKTKMEQNIFETFKIIVKGKQNWIRAKEVSGWIQEDDEEDESDDDTLDNESDGDKIEDDLQAHPVNECNSDAVPDTIFSQETSKQDNETSIKEGEIQSEDSFNIYDLLLKKPSSNNKEDESSKATLKYPPGFTPEEDLRSKYDQEVFENMEEQAPKQNNYFIPIQGDWIPNAKRYLIISIYAPQEASEKRMLWSYLNHVIDRWNGETILMGDFNKTRLWVRDKKESESMKKTQLKGMLKDIDLLFDEKKVDRELLNKKVNVMNSLHDLEKLEATKIAQKVKINWSIEGDENSKYFMERFDSPCSSRLLLDRVFPNRLSVEQNLDLERNVTNEETKRAVWDCGTDKSPGSDGLTFGFYRRYWDTIEKDVEAVSFFFTSCTFPKGGNASFIALILKMQDAKVVKDYKPICLIDSMYKIIAKILANRLVGVLGDLVNEVQSAFIVNRQILDGPFILDELIHWCKSKKKETMIFKVDLEKAYDSVRWDYLDDVLNKFGFGSKWRVWIHNCLNSSKGSILVNGSPTGEFHFQKGLKQGDHLSPFLFLLIMDSLYLSFQNLVNEGLFKGVSVSSSLHLSHLFYADDVIFMGQWSETNINILVQALDCFYKALGLWMNLNKSKLMGITVEDELVSRVGIKMGCSTLKTPFSYLGIKVGGLMSRIKALDEIVDKYKAKESCMVSFQILHSHLKALLNIESNGTQIGGGFERAFVALFDQNSETFTSTMFLNLDQLEKQLDKEAFQEIGSIDAFRALMTQFHTFINFRYHFDDVEGAMICKFFQAHTRTEIQQFRDTLIQHMESVKKSIDERAQHKREYNSRVNEILMRTIEEKVDTSQALDASLVDTKSSRTKSIEQDTSSRSGNDAHADDADIKPIYDEEPMPKESDTSVLEDLKALSWKTCQGEDIRRKIFIGVDPKENKMSWFKWSRVLTSKDKRGLGAKFIRVVHGNSGGIEMGSKISYSSTWSSIVNEVNMLRNKGIDLLSYMNTKVGNGLDTNFWEDVWMGIENFKTTFPRIYALESNKKHTMASKMNQNDVGFCLRRQARDGVEMEQFRLLTSAIEGVVLPDMNDRWFWSLEGSGEFSVASARKFIDDNRLLGPPQKTRWINVVPIKNNILAWKVQFDFLPTRLNLSRRGIEIQSACCPVCNKEVESTSYIFFTCSLVRDIYRKITSWWELTYSKFDSYEEWLTWILSLRISSKQKDMLEGIYYVIWWLVWNHWNKSIFDSKSPSKAIIFDDLVSRSFYWCRYRCKARFSWLEWMKNPNLISLQFVSSFLLAFISFRRSNKKSPN
nr:RNA-directed DNA polymerase, eukaryota, reverse transcriptase zinc-binding domain protein [Tanacetum cinerariifolium]